MVLLSLVLAPGCIVSAPRDEGAESDSPEDENDAYTLCGVLPVAGGEVNDREYQNYNRHAAKDGAFVGLFFCYRGWWRGIRQVRADAGCQSVHLVNKEKPLGEELNAVFAVVLLMPHDDIATPMAVFSHLFD